MAIIVWFARYKSLPIIFGIIGIIGILILAYSFFTMRTVPGRYLYAMGCNEKAAKLSGINTNKVLSLAYVNSGALAAVALDVMSKKKARWRATAAPGKKPGQARPSLS